MPVEWEAATARIPVKPTTLQALADLAGKGTTYDELLQDMIRVYRKRGGRA